MSKASHLQETVIEAIVNELNYWQTSNDIHSPSHGTSIEHDMFANLDEYDNPTQVNLDEICSKVRELHGLIAALTPCKIREEEFKRLFPNAKR
jgi:hypothetical protein